MPIFSRRILLCIPLFLLLFSSLAQYSAEKKEKRFSISIGAGYMNEWFRSEGKDPFTGADLDQIFSPNHGAIFWVSAYYKFKKDYYFQFSYDQENTIEDDLGKNYWMRALHFSVGQSTMLKKISLNFFLGLSSIREVRMIYSISVDSNQEIVNSEISFFANDLAYIHPHAGIDFNYSIAPNLLVGIRGKVISDFSTFGRYDFSLMLSTTF